MTGAPVDMKKIGTDPRMIVLRDNFKQAVANLNIEKACPENQHRHHSCMNSTAGYSKLFDAFAEAVDQRAQDLRVIDASSPNSLVATIRRIHYRMKNKSTGHLIKHAPENLAELAFGY